MGWVVGVLGLVFMLIGFVKYSTNTSKRLIRDRLLESIWLVIPAFVLVSMSVPALVSLYKRDDQPVLRRMAIKTTGLQWYWNYEISERVERYIDTNNRDRVTYLRREEELTLPTNSTVLNIISASDVIHCWTLPELILKVDAIPGRVNLVTLNLRNVIRPVKIYGQCSELCGVNHRFIPISIKVV